MKFFRCVFVLTLIVSVFGIDSLYGQSKSEKRSRKKKVVETIIEYRVDTVYVVDTVYKIVEKRISADTLFSFANIKSSKLNEIDSCINVLYEENMINNAKHFNSVSSIDDSVKFDSRILDLSDKELRSRFEALYTKIDLPYHPILKNFISRYIDYKGSMDVLLRRSLLFMPIFEQELLKQGMPLELKLLPVVESSLIPNAISYMGAGGLWQFMPATAKMYGLRITSLVDERFDPVKSTEAACRYLKDLNKIYNNWTLAIAAYNCGPGNVNKALRQVKNAENYWDIYPNLPSQTRDYVPMFIAANYAFTYYSNHGITFDYLPETIVTDTVTIRNRVVDLRQISSTLDISEKVIKILNPQFKEWIVPAIIREYTINLPKQNVFDFHVRKEEIFAKDTLYLPKKLTAKDITKLETNPMVYIVKSGDVLSTICSRHRVSVSRIIRINNLRNANSLRIGQKIRLS